MPRKLVVPVFFSLFLLTANANADPIVDEPVDHGLPAFVGSAFVAKPLPRKEMVPHPLLAAQSSIHVDMYNTDATDLLTPLGVNPVVTSASFGSSVGTCLNFVFDGKGRLFAFCGTMKGTKIAFDLTWIDPSSLTKKATFPLLELTIGELLGLPLDLGYMVFDAESRFLAIDKTNKVQFVGPNDDEAAPALEAKKVLDLSMYVDPARDHVATVVPDYEGHLFYLTLGKGDKNGLVTTAALLGVIDEKTGAKVQRELTGEFVENGLAVGPDGVFVLTDRAQYGFRYDAATNTIVQIFRQPYARATKMKQGGIAWGSGSTPTLMGDHLIAITDNADDQIHLQVYDRRESPPGGRRVVCDVPVFDAGSSANENSVIGVGRSIVVQNWYGAPSSFLDGNQRDMVPGLVRFDVRADDSGCDRVWYTQELATPATLKLSTATGLLYGAALDRSAPEGVDAFYLNAVDFATGLTIYKARLGVGPSAGIQLSPTYIGPDGAIYQPVRTGMYKVVDGIADPPKPPPPSDDSGGGCDFRGRPTDTKAWALLALWFILALVRRVSFFRRASTRDRRSSASSDARTPCSTTP